jgi:hypothetical protein
MPNIRLTNEIPVKKLDYSATIGEIIDERRPSLD